MVFTHDMADWLSFNIDEAWLAENISWKDFGTGVRLGKLKREEKTSLVLYEAQSDVEVDAFMPHSHPGGECYVVLEGEVWDEDGSYPTGSIVWMDPESTHTPKTRGKTLILVLWPQGVKAARSRTTQIRLQQRVQLHHVPTHDARQGRQPKGQSA